jgi:molybdate-binding protein/DNA-binding XRE family transcriptional regulator
MNAQNKITELRRKRGISAADLAAQVGISRQTIYSIEAGVYVPNTLVALKLSRVLGVPVEDLFRLEDEAAPARLAEEVRLIPDAQHAEPGRPVQLCKVGTQLVAAYPEAVNWKLPLADGILVDPSRAAKRKGKATVQLFHEEKELGKRLLVAGCDPGISVLGRHLQRAGVELVSINCNSSQSLDLLKKGLVHIAGTHLLDHATGESNLAAVRKRFTGNAVAVIGFAIWDEGLVVAAANPKRIRSTADIARKDVTVVNREAGAGCRILLDVHLEKLGVAADAVNGYNQIAYGHLHAAWSVLTGKADCCIATKAAARVFGLDFVPLLRERYDLVIRKPNLNQPIVQTLLETLGRSAFRRELEGLGGYDTTPAGSRMA